MCHDRFRKYEKRETNKKYYVYKNKVSICNCWKL